MITPVRQGNKLAETGVQSYKENPRYQGGGSPVWEKETKQITLVDAGGRERFKRFL